MSAKFFLDTNTLIYILEGRALAEGAQLTAAESEANRKGDVTLRLLENDGLTLGIQVFNELCSVALRRKFDWNKTREMLNTLEALCQQVLPLTLATHKRALFLHQKYRFGFYDALMLAAALEAGCSTFYSEDMQDGQIVEQKMAIKNPFQ